MLKRLSAPIAAMSLAAIVVASAGTGAVAQRLIGSRDVANNSLTGKDIKNRSLTGNDVKDGSLTAADISGGLPAGAPGAAGATGPQGPKGDTGPAGATGSTSTTSVYRLRVQFVADGRTEKGPAVYTTQESIPAYSRVEGGLIDVTGDFATCGDYYVRLSVPGDNYPLTVIQDGRGGFSYAAGGQRVGKVAGPLTVQAGCQEINGGGIGEIPSFEATIVFHVTPMDGPIAREFS